MISDNSNKSIRISVCMASYNGELYIERQLKSILAQLGENDEIIISDDGSTDNTLKIIAEISDSRIQLICSNSNHLGPIYNLERALQKANGEYIFLADQDDIWLENKVKIIEKVLNNYTLAMHDAYLLKEINGIWKNSSLLSKIRPYKKGIFFNWLKNSYTGCCLAFKKELLDKALPFPKNLPMHDQWFGILAEKFYNVIFVNNPLIEYRQHNNNATHILGGKNGIYQKIKWRVDLLKALKSID